MKQLTRQAIIVSFMKQLSEKQLKDITVKNIVDDLGLNRKTFYYYFNGIYDLTETIFLEYVEQLYRDYPPEKHLWAEALKALSVFMKNNQKITMHIYGTIGYEKMEDVFYRTCLRYFPENLKEAGRGLSIKETHLSLLSVYYASAFSGILSRWVRDGMNTLPESIVDDFSAIMGGTSRTALENSARIIG